MKLITETSNPFVHLAILIANNKGDFDKSSFSLIETFINNGFHLHHDINETFLIQDKDYSNYYSYKDKQYETNFFNSVFILDNSFNPKLINKLVDSGLKFNPFKKTSANIDEEIQNNDINDILFTRVELDEQRNIFLLKLFLKQNGIEEFTKQISRCNTLHRAITLNKIDLTKFLLEHVSIDIKNENLETAIMYAKNIDTLKFLSEYNPNWSIKTALGHDCSYYYSGISDDKTKKDLLNFYVEKISTNSKENEILDSDIINEKIKTTLLNLVEKDATKAELSGFIKKYKLKNFEGFTNKNNRTLGHILISKQDFARFDLFPNTDLYHVDNNGYNIFASLLSCDGLSETKTKLAKQFILRCLENPEKNMSEKVFDRLIDLGLNQSRIGSWILKDPFIRNQMLNVFEKKPGEIDFNIYLNKGSSITDNEKTKFYFSLFSNLMTKYDIKSLNSDIILKNFINISDCINNYEIKFDKNYMDKLVILMNEYSNTNKLSLSELFEKTFSNINEHFYELLSKNKIWGKERFETDEEFLLESKRSFYKDFAIPFFHFLVETKLDNLIIKINKNIVEEINNFIQKEDNFNQYLFQKFEEFGKIYSYLNLNNKLELKNIKNKPGKI